jgi:acyl carrier protein
MTADQQPSNANHIGTLETRLREIWQRVLKVQHVADMDDFVALGGSSVAAAQLCMEIEREFEARLPLPVVFKARTLGELASGLRQVNWPPQKPAEKKA